MNNEQTLSGLQNLGHQALFYIAGLNHSYYQAITIILAILGFLLILTVFEHFPKLFLFIFFAGAFLYMAWDNTANGTEDRGITRYNLPSIPAVPR